ncbi:hypothetical protein Sjap_025248 [Stephania japonica]|uniref:Senescence regulator n=1 Tax=Stephania japonica TaxID=461633 RepID=A0AAP0HHD2_9MAGN
MGRSRRSGPIRFNYNNGNDDHHGPVGLGSMDLDLREEDVWSTVEDGMSRSDQSTSEYVDRSIRSQRWLNGEDRGHVGGLSLAFKDGGGSQSARIIQQCHHDEVESTPRRRHVAASAPVNVPDWSMMSRAESNGSSHGWTEEEEDEDKEEDTELVPPHVYLAREYAQRHKTVATSVLEGVGRTLKGRDMSRVRDAVWSQTGFDG